MTKGLTGIPSLSYLGVNAGSPPNVRMYNRAPTVNDWQNFIVGDIWINITPTPAIAREVYMLVALLHNQATWLKLFSGTGGNAITALLDQTGLPDYPLATGFINVIGDGTYLKTVASANTITISPVNGGLMSGLTADTGITAVPTVAGLIDVKGGANINTVGSANTITVNLDTSILQPATTADQSAGVYSLGGNPFLHAFGVANTFLGINSGNFTLTGSGNSFLGYLVGANLTSGTGNSIGGALSAGLLTSGSMNSIWGYNSGPNLLSGVYNVFLGPYLGANYVNAESSNILIGSNIPGVVGESNVLRIGNATGVAAGNLANDYIAGIYNTASGVAYLGTAPKMVAIGSDNKITSSPNIYMPTTTATEGQVIINGVPFMHNYGDPSNVFLGGAGNLSITPGTSLVTLIGNLAGNNLTSGTSSTFVGAYSGDQVTSGTNNTFIGEKSAYGGAGNSVKTGSYNTFIGSITGDGLLDTESNNIFIGAQVSGVAGDNCTLRIGNITGTGIGYLNAAFIHGIRGITTGNANAIAVLIDSAGQLGTVSSSIRYKENVKDISDVSDIISKLRPVEFNYKKHTAADKQYGLIAEEVAPIWPEMLVYDKEGQPETLKYQYLPIILLKEIQKLTKRIEELEKRK